MINLTVLFLLLFFSPTQTANDNFKGVATLYAAAPRVTIRHHVGHNFDVCGSITSLFLAEALLKNFLGPWFGHQRAAA